MKHLEEFLYDYPDCPRPQELIVTMYFFGTILFCNVKVLVPTKLWHQ